ncbi:MAG: DUF559 domain-containing protein [Myxococcales bacterium]|nr:DUF559 domain-containing protein [Myxococcales bacterium]
MRLRAPRTSCRMRSGWRLGGSLWTPRRSARAQLPEPSSAPLPEPSPAPLLGRGESSRARRDGVSVPAPLSLGRGAGGEGLSPGAEALSTGGEGLSAGGEGLAPGADALSGRNRSIPAGLLRLARDLRERQTPAEDFLWQCLRDRQLNGAKFRRQHNIGRFIVDFYCHEARLVIELDGSVHEGREEQDGARQRWLEAAGLRVLRFSNDRVDLDLLEVLWEILKATGAPREAHGAPPGALTPSPSPSRGEGSRASVRHATRSPSGPLSLGRGAGGEAPRG